MTCVSGNYFYIHIYFLLDFDIDNLVIFDTKYFFFFRVIYTSHYFHNPTQSFNEHPVANTCLSNLIHII